MRMLVKRLSAAVLAASCWGAGISYAQADNGLPELQNSSGSASIYWMLVKVILFLVVIIGIFILIMKVVSQKNRAFQSGRSVKSVGGLGLGQNKSVQLVQIGRSLYVLGVGNDVELIAKIDDEEEIEHITANLHSGASSNFKAFPTVTEWLKRLTGRQNRSEELDVDSSFQAVFQEKMQRLTSRQQKVEELLSQDNETQNERLNDKS